MAEGHDSGAQPASCSLPSPRRRSSTQTWLPVESPLRPSWSECSTEQDEESGKRSAGMQTSERPSSRFYEELFCTSQTSIPLVPLAGVLITSSGPQSDVVKQGHLGKLERNHRRYFVLRTGSHTGPSRLEWYKNQEKFRAMEKSAGKAALFGSNKQGVIYLRCCLGVSRIGGSRKGHTVALYAKDQTMVLVMEDQPEQEDWYVAIKKLMEEEQKDDEHREGVDEEDDGYCTLPPAGFFKEVWPVTVKYRGLGASKSLTGENRLCLTATSLILVRVGAGNDLPSVTIPLLSVRRFGHLDELFFLELGRSAPNGPGEIWMEARDQGNPTVAQHIHEAVRETVRALRALPDFSRSPTSSHNQPQALLASKRCRPKYRDKLVNVRPLGSLTQLPRHPDIQTSAAQCHQTPHNPDKTTPESSLSSTSILSPSTSRQGSSPQTGSYMEMKMNHCSVVACGMQSWGLVEEEEEGPEYMLMSPQVSHSFSVLVQDDYVIMASPHKHDQPAYSSSPSSLQTSFNSFTSDSYSPLHPSCHQTNEHSQPHWLLSSLQQSQTEAGQSQTSISCCARAQDDPRQEQKPAQHSPHPAQTRAAPPPVGSADVSDLMSPFVTSGLDCARPLQDSPNSGAGQTNRLQAEPDQCAVRYWLSSCLPSCLQAEDRSECL